MALYVGETVRVKSSGTNLDESSPLTDTDVESVEVTIYDSAGDVVVGPESLTYDSTDVEWYYDWDTEGEAAGSYRAKVIYHGVTFIGWEFIRIRLRSNPV